jgi:hypothetical protein
MIKRKKPQFRLASTKLDQAHPANNAKRGRLVPRFKEKLAGSASYIASAFFTAAVSLCPLGKAREENQSIKRPLRSNKYL